MIEQLNLWSLISFQAILALILLFFLVRLSRKNNVHIPLLVFAVLAVYDSVLLLLSYSGVIEEFSYLAKSNELLFLLYGLLFFLYIRNLLHQQFFFKKNDLLLFAPFVLSAIAYLPYFFATNSQELSNISPDDFSTEIWELIFYFTVNTYFLIKALKKINAYNLTQKNQLSDVENSNLHYTSILIKTCIALFCVELILVYADHFDLLYFDSLNLIFHLLNGMISLLIALDAVVHSTYILENQNSLIKMAVLRDIRKDDEIVKYAKSGLDVKTSDDIKSRLLKFMKEEKPYLKQKLRIKEFSDQIDVPTHHLSQVINECFEQNFYEFINSYRIEEAVNILKDPRYQNYTYESIAFEVGFNSRSAFYTAFRKIYNTTPTKHLKQGK